MKDDLDAKKITSSAHDVHDTVAAISTPPGPGGVGMVRISGPDALIVGSSIFTPLGSNTVKVAGPRKAVTGHVHRPRNSGVTQGSASGCLTNVPHAFSESDPLETDQTGIDTIDQAIWVSFVSPRSFTGEDTVELTTHGGPLILREVLEAAIQAGARLAEPGEFTRRAFLNGRIDLSQAESVASLIFASTEEARHVMQKQVEGAMGREADWIRARLLEIKVDLESSIDFPEDLEEVDYLKLTSQTDRIVERVEKLLDTSRVGIALSEGLKVVIAGAPNVGKSSLLNSLLEDDRAIVHEVAGTTRDFIEGRINVKGVPMVVVDTAGIRVEPDPLEDLGIVRTKRLMKNADLLLVVMDRSRPASPDEQDLLNETSADLRVVVVNKCDLARHPEFDAPDKAVEISALTGHGMDVLKGAIHDTYAGAGPDLTGADAVVTSLRQAAALEKIREGCLRAGNSLKKSAGPELVAVDLEDALLGVGELTGEVTVDEVLEEIFARFCVGK